MKKIIAMLLAVMLLAGLFCGCGKDKDDSGKSGKSGKAAKNEITFEEQTIVDSDDYTVTMTGFEIDEMWGPEFTCSFENNTDKNLNFQFSNCLVNGDVALDEWFSQNVNAGANAEYEMTWLDVTLKTNCINYIESYAGTLIVSDADDWFADPIEEIPFEIEVGNSSSDPATGEPEFDYDEVVLCDTDEAKITVVDVTYDKDYDYPLAIVKVENKTSDVNVSYSANDCEVNGTMNTSLWGGSIPAGGYAYTRFTLLDTDGLEEIENCKFTLRVYNADDIFADNFFSEMVEF